MCSLLFDTPSSAPSLLGRTTFDDEAMKQLYLNSSGYKYDYPDMQSPCKNLDLNYNNGPEAVPLDMSTKTLSLIQTETKPIETPSTCQLSVSLPVPPNPYQPGNGKRQRTEKRPVPTESKDDKYFERRQRNNHAAKKSRDSRKQREDEIAIRASFLEKENSILRAQVSTLREEANSLRQLLLQRRIRPNN